MKVRNPTYLTAHGSLSDCFTEIQIPIQPDSQGHEENTIRWSMEWQHYSFVDTNNTQHERTSVLHGPQRQIARVQQLEETFRGIRSILLRRRGALHDREVAEEQVVLESRWPQSQDYSSFEHRIGLPLPEPALPIPHFPDDSPLSRSNSIIYHLRRLARRIGYRNLRDRVNADLGGEDLHISRLINSPQLDYPTAEHVEFAQPEIVQPRRIRRFALWRRGLQSTSAGSQAGRAPRRMFSRS